MSTKSKPQTLEEFLAGCDVAVMSPASYHYRDTVEKLVALVRELKSQRDEYCEPQFVEAADKAIADILNPETGE